MAPRFRNGFGFPVTGRRLIEDAVAVGVGQVGVGIDFPTSCGPSQYWDVLSLSCKDYDPGSTDDTGLPLPGSCPDGTHWTSDGCVPDPDKDCAKYGNGWVWSDADQICVAPCAMGFELTDQGCTPSACSQPGWGRSKYQADTEPCMECVYGIDDQGFCKDCPDGYDFDPSTGQCSGAPAGTCPQGQGTSDVTGQCVDCTWGVDPDGSCTICPQGTTYNAAGDNGNGSCDCPGGSVWSDAGGKCVPWNPPKTGGGQTPPPPADKTPPKKDDNYTPPTNMITGDTSMVGKVVGFVAATLLAAGATIGIVKATKKKRRR